MQADVFREYLLLVTAGAGLLVGAPALLFCLSAQKEIREKGLRSALAEFLIG